MRLPLKSCLAVFFTASSLTACVNTHDTFTQQYEYADKDLQQQCLAQLQTLQQTTVPLFHDDQNEPVYRDVPAIETFHCSIMPPLSPSIKELNQRKPKTAN